MKRLLAMGVVMLMILPAIPAQAHNPVSLYIIKWVRDKSQSYRFVEGYPTGSRRTVVNNAAADWKGLAGHMGFTVNANADWANYRWNTCPKSYGTNGIHWVNLSPPALARVAICSENNPSYSEAISANMAVDSNLGNGMTWFSAASGTPTSSQYDLRSAAAHEWGHMGGRITGGVTFDGHWGKTGKWCTGANGIAKHTLCPELPSGTTYARTTEQHDNDTFNNAYP